MPWTWKAAAVRGFSSTFTLPKRMSRRSAASCFDGGVEGEPLVGIYGEFEGIAVACGEQLRLVAVDPDRRRRGVGRALLRNAETQVARVVAAEPGNYFTPGVPASDTTTLKFFSAHGYRETARTQNL